MAHPPRIPVWLKWEQSVVYFITFCVQDRQKVLANDEAFEAFRNAATRHQRWSVIAGLLMPDHVHLLAAPTFNREEKVGTLTGALKRWMRQELRASWQWQPGSFDRLLRSDESAQSKWLYIRENPVRAGFVTHWSEWPYRLGFDDAQL